MSLLTGLRLPELLHRSPPTTHRIRVPQESLEQAFSTVRSLPPGECVPNHEALHPGRFAVPPPPADPHVVEDKFQRTCPFLARCPLRYIHYSVSRCRTQWPAPVPCPCPVLWW